MGMKCEGTGKAEGWMILGGKKGSERNENVQGNREKVGNKRRKEEVFLGRKLSGKKQMRGHLNVRQEKEQKLRKKGMRKNDGKLMVMVCKETDVIKGMLSQENENESEVKKLGRKRFCLLRDINTGFDARILR
jgi:hypothetical protein